MVDGSSGTSCIPALPAHSCGAKRERIAVPLNGAVYPHSEWSEVPMLSAVGLAIRPFV